MHVTSEPGILYFGTPVVLISTTNEDGSYNLAPMSSAFGSAGAAFWVSPEHPRLRRTSCGPASASSICRPSTMSLQ
jgi:hypothetical protein